MSKNKPTAATRKGAKLADLKARENPKGGFRPSFFDVFVGDATGRPRLPGGQEGEK